MPARWDTFSDQTGISAVLHLRPAFPASFTGPTPRAFLWIDLAEEGEAGVKARGLAARFIGENLAEGFRVLIHSSISRHRTRWAYVAYLIWSGKRVRTALRRAAEKPWLSPYDTDEEAWAEFDAWVKARKLP